MPENAEIVRRSWAIRVCQAIVFLLVCACAVIAIVDRYRDARTERSLAAITSAGGLAMRNDRARARPVIGIDLDAVTVLDTGQVRRRGHVTDQTLLVVADFGQLEELSLDGADVTDLGLACLHGLKELRRLNIANTRVTDSGLELLKGLPKLTLVDLRGTSVTPEGITRLRRALPNAQVYDDSKTAAATAQ
jgi:hypothetical protein